MEYRATEYSATSFVPAGGGTDSRQGDTDVQAGTEAGQHGDADPGHPRRSNPARLIESRSGGRLEFLVSSLYSVLYRMEHKGWIKGRWVEKKGERRRCYYSLTDEGGKVLTRQRQEWEAFTLAVNEVMGESHA